MIVRFFWLNSVEMLLPFFEPIFWIKLILFDTGICFEFCFVQIVRLFVSALVPNCEIKLSPFYYCDYLYSLLSVYIMIFYLIGKKKVCLNICVLFSFLLWILLLTCWLKFCKCHQKNKPHKLYWKKLTRQLRK